jgi:zinc protease
MKYLSRLIFLQLGVLALCLPSLRAADAPADAASVTVDIPYQKFVLSNGLTLIVHEDHKAPIVAVNTWYHVGSKNEKPGKTGFAHLFEHLMFSGSEHFQSGGNQRAFFEAMERIGATDMNGTTSNDRTDFFENVPTNALDVALWLESDRMGHLLGAVDEARLTTQRGVVQNEKRQDENQPYAVADELITKATTPVGHPYSWTVIGSMDDLNAASLDDVKQWFKTYYGPANAILVIAGDIDPQTALKKVEQYYGDIPSGPPVARFKSWIPEVPGTRRATVTDHVPQARVYKVWNVPEYGEEDATYLDLASSILASGKTSRLYKRLVYDDQIATDVSAYIDPREISGQFQIVATAKLGGDLAQVEKAIDEELAHFQQDGPTSAELDRAKAESISSFVRGAQRVGGFGGKSDILAMNEAYRGDPGFYQTNLDFVRSATQEDIQQAAKNWLNDDVYVLEVTPFPKYETATNGVDRSKLPTPNANTAVTFPTLQRATLSNGLKIVLAERHAVPLVSFNLQLDAGYAADQFAAPGTASMTMDMLDEGTATRSALEISDQLKALGADFSAGSGLDTCSVNLSALTATMDPALEIYADSILSPAFPEDEFKRLQKQRIAGIQQEKTTPFGLAGRILPPLIYGKNHAYGAPLSGSGTEASVAAMTPDELRKFHDTWFKPNNATLIIVGDTTLADIMPKLEKLFGGWKSGDVPTKNLAAVEPQKAVAVYLIDRPDSIQSVILAGSASPPKSDPNHLAIETMNTILGGNFASRINLNLREDKHWSYGSGSSVRDARGQCPFFVIAQVQSDKTKESMVELDKELHGVLGDRPITPDELTMAQKLRTLTLPGRWETIGAVSGSIGEIVRFGLPDDYYATFPDRIRALTADDLAKAAQTVVHPDQLIWVIVGDRAKIEPGIRALNWAPVQFLNPDGEPIQ